MTFLAMTKRGVIWVTNHPNEYTILTTIAIAIIVGGNVAE